jgi:two-component system LytT family response regulator
MGSILIADKQVIRSVSSSEIVRLESRGIYTIVFSKSRKEHVCSKNLGVIHLKLDQQIFIRVHHSHVINIQEVDRYEKGRGGHVIMKDGSAIPVSTRKKPIFLRCFSGLLG